MDDINELIVTNDEIGEQLAQPIGAPMDEVSFTSNSSLTDDLQDELEQQLEDFERELVDQQLAIAPSVPSKPVTVDNSQSKVATKSVSSVSLSSASSISSDEQNQLRALEAELGL